MKRLLLVVATSILAHMGHGAQGADLAEVYCKDSFTRFRNESYPREIANGQFTDIPERFASWKFSYPDSYPAEQKQGLKFKVKKPGLVYLVTTQAGSKHVTSDGWKVVGEFFVDIRGTKYKNMILEKHLPEGQYEIGVGIEDALGFRLLKK